MLPAFYEEVSLFPKCFILLLLKYFSAEFHFNNSLINKMDEFYLIFKSRKHHPKIAKYFNQFLINRNLRASCVTKNKRIDREKLRRQHESWKIRRHCQKNIKLELVKLESDEYLMIFLFFFFIVLNEPTQCHQSSLWWSEKWKMVHQ